MKYQALFLDIDDTLLSRQRPVSPGNLAAIRRAQAAGMLVTIATGRGGFGARPVWESLGIEGPVILYGGATAIDTRTGENVFFEGLDIPAVREALTFAREVGVYAHIYDHDVVLTEKEIPFTGIYCARQNLTFRVVPELRGEGCRETPKVLVYVDPAEESRYQAIFRERFEGQLEVAASQPGFIELNRLHCNKGTALLRVAEILGIPREATAAAGDNTLDLEMLRMAGLSACVANGQQVVKEAADMVIPACDEDGVAWFIDHCLLS